VEQRWQAGTGQRTLITHQLSLFLQDALRCRISSPERGRVATSTGNLMNGVATSQEIFLSVKFHPSQAAEMFTKKTDMKPKGITPNR
jgi:hypothetical protein